EPGRIRKRGGSRSQALHGASLVRSAWQSRTLDSCQPIRPGWDNRTDFGPACPRAWNQPATRQSARRESGEQTAKDRSFRDAGSIGDMRMSSSGNIAASSVPPFPPDYRASGVLLHVTSLPSRYGIGDVGPSALAWIDRMHEAGQSWWQALPIG